MSRKIMALPQWAGLIAAMAAACSNDSGLGGGDATDDGGPSRNDASHDGGGEDRPDTGTTVVHQVTRFDLHGAGNATTVNGLRGPATGSPGKILIRP